MNPEGGPLMTNILPLTMRRAFGSVSMAGMVVMLMVLFYLGWSVLRLSLELFWIYDGT